MAANSKELVARIQELLDRLVESRDLDSDEQEAIADQVFAEASELRRDGIVDALDKAIGRSKRRRQEAVYLLSTWTDIPEALHRIGEWLTDSDPDWRSWLIQIVAEKRLFQFAPTLKNVIEDDSDEFCRGMAIHAAGVLRSDECLPAILRLAERNHGSFISRLVRTLRPNDPSLTSRLAIALSSYAAEECRPHLQKWFDDKSQEKSIRVLAAWGLGKLRDKRAVEYLISMLDDPDEEGPGYFTPGESIRAAQAVCDIFNWSFEWNKSYVAATKKRLNQLHSQA